MFKRISIIDAAKKIQDGAQLIDIRDANAFAVGHAPGALNLNNQNVQEFLNKANPDAPLLVMCYHGHSSQNAAQFFVSQGFAEVYSVDGGFETWKLTQPVSS